MSAFLDSSVLVAALAPDESKHADCLALLLQGGNCIYSHALLETFSTLTGGKLGVRVTICHGTPAVSKETPIPCWKPSDGWMRS
jgi:predicted nucleic acid-binding protein